MRSTKHAKFKRWLTARPRFHLHFTPTYPSWRNQQAFVDAYNASATPFVWVATAQSIIDKESRLTMRISGTAHWRDPGMVARYAASVDV